jgi:hypothetical protein
MTMTQTLKDAANGNLIATSFGDGGYTFFDPKAARQAREEDAARRALLNKILAEDEWIAPQSVLKAGRAIQAVGKSRIGRALLGWMDTALFVVAVHVVPVLWILDEFKKKDHASSLAMFHITMRDLYQGRWYEGHRMVSPTGFFSRHPLCAAGVGALVFLLSSPMVVVSLPLVVASRTRDAFRVWLRRYKIKHNLV